jgi:hypothetical protein
MTNSNAAAVPGPRPGYGMCLLNIIIWDYSPADIGREQRDDT